MDNEAMNNKTWKVFGRVEFFKVREVLGEELSGMRHWF